jgi:hypothetical protein
MADLCDRPVAEVMVSEILDVLLEALLEMADIPEG